MSLKEQKEQFVTGLLGGSVLEIYKVTAVGLAGYLGYTLITSGMGKSAPLPLDFALNVLSTLCSLTLYSSNVRVLYLLVLGPCIGYYILNRSKYPVKPARKANKEELLVKKPFITAYRSIMMVLTNIAILAVDFHIFPRRFAKVETWGTSMMDLGVGSFVFSMGLVNSRALIKQAFQPGNPDYKFSFSKYMQLVIRNTYKALPVLMLGVIRLLSVKTLEYQEHVTEYGIHWNFFMTLGLLPIFLAILDPILNIVPRAIVALVIGLVYEFALNKTHLLEFILRSDNRMDNIVTMNKEGIFSFIGYFSIFLFGQSFGSFVLTDFQTPNNLLKMSTYRAFKNTKKRNFFTVTTTEGLMICSVFYQTLFWLVKESFYFTAVSRRLANFSYIIWTVSYNSVMLLAFNMIDKTFLRENAESRVFKAINANGLAIFLLANLGTGLVNMTIDTLSCSDFIAFVVLLVYCGLFTGIAMVLDLYGIYIKL